MDTVNSQTSFWISKDFTFQFQSVWKQFTYTNKNVSIEDDKGNKQELVNQLVAVSNGGYFGSGMNVNPTAVVNDGKFSLCSFADVGVKDMLGTILPNIYTGEHYKSDKVLFGECTVLNAKPVNASDHIFIECDGELSGQLPCTMTNCAAVLPLVVPQ